MSVIVPSGYKQTKVGVIPEDWDVVKLGDVATFYKGKGISKKEISTSGISCIRYGELYTKYNERIETIISKTSTPKGELFLSQENDILIPASGETAIDLATASCILKDDIGLGGDINIIRSSLDGIFLSYYLNTIAKIKIASLAQGVSVIHLYSSQLKSLYIARPPLKEQQKIAQILTTWDDAISKQESLIKAKEELKKGLMQRLLSGEVRFGGFDGEWGEVRLGDVTTRVTTKNTDSSIDMVLSNSAVKGIVIQNEFFDKDIANRDNLTGYYIVESDDFVYNPRISKHAPSGPINRNKHKFSGIVSPLYTVFRTNDTEILDYFEYFFSSTLWFRYMKAIANYGARYDRMNITNKDFMKMPIPYPSKHEQQKIAQVLTLVDKEIDLLKTELDGLKEQKCGLMQGLLSGGVRTNNIKERE